MPPGLVEAIRNEPKSQATHWTWNIRRASFGDGGHHRFDLLGWTRFVPFQPWVSCLLASSVLISCFESTMNLRGPASTSICPLIPQQ